MITQLFILSEDSLYCKNINGFTFFTSIQIGLINPYDVSCRLQGKMLLKTFNKVLESFPSEEFHEMSICLWLIT